MFKGEVVRRVREEKGYSLAELAEKAGISFSYLSEIERGSKKPSIKTVEKLTSFLNISPGELVGNTEQDGISLGERVRLLRQERGLSLQELAESAGLSYSYICEIERGLVKPSLRALRKTAAALNVPVNQIKASGNSLGGKIARVRQEYGLKQVQLAKKAGVSAGLIGQIEQGKVQPSLQTVEKIAGAFGISPCYFITGEDGIEDFLHRLTPELRKLLLEPQVQGVLRALCHCNEKEFRFILEFIRIFKGARLCN
ncbi:MAG TPA: transcriptional regulator [Firmicutes bacterium]|nr:transcriptional regulator [Bacillota bacterium]